MVQAKWLSTNNLWTHTYTQMLNDLLLKQVKNRRGKQVPQKAVKINTFCSVSSFLDSMIPPFIAPSLCCAEFLGTLADSFVPPPLSLRCCQDAAFVGSPELLPTKLREKPRGGGTPYTLERLLDSTPEHINSNSWVNKDVLQAHKSLKCSQYHPHAAGEALDLGETFSAECNQKTEISALICSDSSGRKKPLGEKEGRKGK